MPVAHPVEREVTDFVDFTGRTAAVESVNIVPRVTGYLEQISFKEGSEVKKGDLLFVVDPRPYDAQFDQAKAQVTLDQASLDLAKSTLLRYEALDKSTPGAVSKQALDQYRASVVEAEARIETQRKSLEVYRLNKEFTHIVSPINGQISRYYLTLGNLVNQDQTLLTTIVSLDPIYVYFDMDERTLLQTRKAMAEGRSCGARNGADLPVLMGLETEEGYPHKGFVNFVNQPGQLHHGEHHLAGQVRQPQCRRRPPATSRGGRCPGCCRRDVRARPLPIGQPHPATLVIDRAIQSDQGLKYVYVVDAQNNAPVPPRHDRAARRRRPARRQRGEAGRLGRRRRHAASPAAHGNQAGGRAHAVAAAQAGASRPSPRGRSDSPTGIAGRAGLSVQPPAAGRDRENEQLK